MNREPPTPEEQQVAWAQTVAIARHALEQTGDLGSAIALLHTAAAHLGKAITLDAGDIIDSIKMSYAITVPGIDNELEKLVAEEQAKWEKQSAENPQATNEAEPKTTP